MGSTTEEGKGAKNEKSSSPPATEVNNNYHVYPDWAAVQAFYGPRLAIPPYSNAPVASSSPATPHYMWAAPQSMIPHYGAPYPAFYAHYAHPGVPMVGSAPAVESPAKSNGNSDAGFAKKLKEKEFDGLAMSIGNGSVDNNGLAAEHRSSDSESTDGSSHGSNGGVAGADKNGRKRSRQEPPNRDTKAQKGVVFPATEVGQASDKSVDVVVSDASAKKPEKVKSNPTNGLQSIPSETWMQNERELKRERRKQSNRESARRSRLRKQAEAEELANKVQALISDNMSLKSEIQKLMEGSDKLKLENAALLEKLKGTRLGPTEDDLRVKPVATVNLLARVNNGGVGDQEDGDGEVYESRSPPAAKLHQLLDAST